MSQHTPGPWTIKPYVDAIDIHAADGSKVASLADRKINSVGMPPENARLIAASPDLLAACRDLIDALQATEICLVSWNKQGSPVNVEGICRHAETIIAKAKGEQ